MFSHHTGPPSACPAGKGIKENNAREHPPACWIAKSLLSARLEIPDPCNTHFGHSWASLWPVSSLAAPPPLAELRCPRPQNPSEDLPAACRLHLLAACLHVLLRCFAVLLLLIATIPSVIPLVYWVWSRERSNPAHTLLLTPLLIFFNTLFFSLSRARARKLNLCPGLSHICPSLRSPSSSAIPSSSRLRSGRTLPASGSRTAPSCLFRLAFVLELPSFPHLLCCPSLTRGFEPCIILPGTLLPPILSPLERSCLPGPFFGCRRH